MDLADVPLAVVDQAGVHLGAAAVAAPLPLVVVDEHTNHAVPAALLVLPLQSKARSLWDVPQTVDRIERR